MTTSYDHKSYIINILRTKWIFVFPYLNNSIPLLLYVLITLFMVCVPIGFDFTTRYIGSGEVVLWSNYFWWFDYSLTHLLANPLHNSYLFYPIGLDMIDCILPLILFVPVTHFFGSVVSYNLYVLLSFILAAYGMYLLGDYLLEDKYVAFISGIIFAFSPFHFASAIGHLHTLSIMWIPFFVLFLFKMSEEPKQLNTLLCGIFFSVIALTSWTIAVMASIFLLVYLIINRKLLDKKYSINLIIFCAISFVIMSPGLYLMLENYLNNEHIIKSIGDFVYNSADILGFVIPSPLHPFLGGISSNNIIYSQLNGNYSENIVFVGYIVIILSIIGFVHCRKDHNAKLFITSLCLFFILSLGPVLHIGSQWKFTEMNLTIMLPGVITSYLPILNMIRVPSRYDIMVMFCLAIIAGYGIKSIFVKYNINKTARMMLSASLALIILFEFSAVMFTMEVVPIPNFYHNISNISNGGDQSIIELPIIRSGLECIDPYGSVMVNYYEYQKVHHKKLFGGYFDRLNPIFAQFAQSDPVISFLYSGQEDIFLEPISRPLSYLRDKYGVEYVVLHENLLSPEILNRLIRYLGNSHIIDNSVSSDRLIIYPTKNLNELDKTKSTENILLHLGDGFNDIENFIGNPTRWMQSDATIIVDTPENRTVNLRFQVLSFYRPRTLEVYAGNELTLQSIVPTSFINATAPMRLTKGENIVRFHVPEGCERPSDIKELNSPDSRCLSVALQNITFTTRT